MRFWDPKTSAFDIEATLVMNVVAGPPSTWQLSPIEGDAGATVSVADDGTWSVKCGQEFTLAMELSDEFGNRRVSLHTVKSTAASGHHPDLAFPDLLHPACLIPICDRPKIC